MATTSAVVSSALECADALLRDGLTSEPVRERAWLFGRPRLVYMTYRCKVCPGSVSIRPENIRTDWERTEWMHWGSCPVQRYREAKREESPDA